MPDQLYCLSYTDVVDIVFQRQEGCKYIINLVIDWAQYCNISRDLHSEQAGTKSTTDLNKKSIKWDLRVFP